MNSLMKNNYADVDLTPTTNLQVYLPQEDDKKQSFNVETMKHPSDFESSHPNGIMHFIEAPIKWALAKYAESSMIPLVESGSWDIQSADLKKKGMPLFPLFDQDSDVAYFVQVLPILKLWAKIKRAVLRLSDNPESYFVMAGENAKPKGPIFGLSRRLGGYLLQGTAISLTRKYVNDEFLFSWSTGGMDNHAIYSYTVISRIDDPVKFYRHAKKYYDIFKTEVESFIREKIKEQYLQNMEEPAFILKGEFSLDVFSKIGYSSDSTYEIVFNYSKKM